MENRQTQGVVVLIAAAGMMLGLLGMELKDVQDWVYATKPEFAGKLLIHLASVIGAFISGQLLPTYNKFK